MSRIEQLISEIEEYIDSCKFQALSNSKIIVNKEEMEELLVELRMRIPDEIKKYQKIISQHGGRLLVDTVPGRGTTIYFTLPLLHEASEPATSELTKGAPA